MAIKGWIPWDFKTNTKVTSRRCPSIQNTVRNIYRFSIHYVPLQIHQNLYLERTAKGSFDKLWRIPLSFSPIRKFYSGYTGPSFTSRERVLLIPTGWVIYWSSPTIAGNFLYSPLIFPSQFASFWRGRRIFNRQW